MGQGILNSMSINPGLSTARGHWVVFLSKMSLCFQEYNFSTRQIIYPKGEKLLYGTDKHARLYHPVLKEKIDIDLVGMSICL